MKLSTAGKTFAIVAFAVALGLSCTNTYKGETEDRVPNLFKIDFISKTTDIYDLGQLIERIDIVPLKEVKGNFIGDIFKVMHVQNRIIVVDKFRSKGIYLFDDRGNFIKKIIGVGRSGNEVLQINDCWLTSKGKLEVYDYALKKIFVFNKEFNFEYVRLVDKNKRYDYLFPIPHSTNYIAYSSVNSFNPQVNNKNYLVEFVDSNLVNLKKGYFAYPNAMKGLTLLSYREPFYNYKDTIRYMMPYDNAIYSFINGNLNQKISINYQTNSINYNEYKKIILDNIRAFKTASGEDPQLEKVDEILKKYNILKENCVETDNFLIFNSRVNGIPLTTVYDKKAKKTLVNSRLLIENTKYNIVLPPLTLANDGYAIGFINSLLLGQTILKSNSVLTKYAGTQWNGFLFVKIKLK